jgi:hypothetical protein
MIDRDRIRERGGLAYGLELAELATREPSSQVVPWAFVPLSDLTPAAIIEQSKTLGPLVLRWSDGKPDEFTAAAHRGDKRRQINAIAADARIERVRELITEAVAAMPATTAGAVLQQQLDLSSACLFDLEVDEDRADVELRTSRARVLACGHDGRAGFEQLGADDLLPDQVEANQVLSRLVSDLDRLPRSPSGWHLEGAWSRTSDTIAVLQLRPIPLDRPTLEAVLPPASCWATTRFVWGAFDLTVDLSECTAEGPDGAPVAVVVRDHAATAMERRVTERLAAGDTVLVVHRESGFRLTHEPFNLPDVGLRSRFLAVHVPPTSDQRLRITSDGDYACFTPA